MTSFSDNDNESTESAPVRALHPPIFYAIVLVVFVGDQVSKSWIRQMLSWEQSRPILGDAFLLTLTRNTGGAWGLAPQNNHLFAVFAVVAIVALVVAYHRMQRVDLFVGAAFALALGGAMGNLVDRLRFGYVVDFFEARIIHWPIFNVADSAITLGICLLALHFASSTWHEVRSARGDHQSDASAGTASLAAGDGGPTSPTPPA